MSEAGEQAKHKRQAAEQAAAEVRNGMVVGLGTGSTAAFAIAALGAAVAGGLRIRAIPTSLAAAALARRHGIPLTDFAADPRIDLTIDGADQVVPGTLDLIKGLGGALLREKLVATASARMIVVADDSKLVARLGGATRLPVEITAFGWQVAMAQLTAAGCAPILRRTGETPFVTDGGNHIADCAIADIPDPAALQARLIAMVGVVETGLFVGLASEARIGGPAGVRLLRRDGAAIRS
jgi:ribose 5-phosphate isomerase A